MSENCSFRDHINTIVDSAKDLSSWILRTFASRLPIVMLTLWKTLVLPRLDRVLLAIMEPFRVGEIQQLEIVQRSFIRTLDGALGLSYWEQLKKFQLYSLQRRRERYKIIYVWEILESIVPNLKKVKKMDQE